MELHQLKHPTHLFSIEIGGVHLKPHKHSAYQVLISQERPLEVRLAGRPVRDSFCLIAAPGVPQEIGPVQGPIRLTYIEPDSPGGRALKQKVLLGKTFRVFHNDHALTGAGSPGTVWIRDIIDRQLPDSGALPDLDDRVRWIARYIRRNHTRPIDHGHLAEVVHLSKSRMSKLFRQEMGTSISKFMLWTRLRKALLHLFNGHPATVAEAALQAGFYDGPSFTRYARAMVGLSPSELRENARLIQE